MNTSFRTSICLAAAMLSGCAAQAATAPDTHVPAAERSGLQSALQSYDRQIAALRATLRPAGFAQNPTQFDAAIAGIRSRVASSAAEIDAAIARKADGFAAAEDAAVSAVLANGSDTAPSRTAVARQLQRDYRAEYAQLRHGAQSDMNGYRQALLETQGRSFQTFVNAVSNRTQQAYFNRAQELREQESNLLLDLARSDAPKRLQIRAKLQTLALSGPVRAHLQTQLAQIQSHENALLSARRSRDAAQLAAYRSALIAQANGDVAAMSAQLQARTQANLAARRDVYVAQRAQPASLPLNANEPARPAASEDLRSRVVAMRAQGANTFRAQAREAVNAYTSAGSDVANRFETIRSDDAASLQSTLAAIARLKADRDALEARIRSY